MHDYSIDRHPKQKVIYALAFGAVVAAPYVNDWIATLIQGAGIFSSPPATAIPVATLFGSAYWVFNKYLWRLPFLRRFLLVPDLNGTWTCTGTTVIKEGQQCKIDWAATITIVQSWSRIRISLQTDRSRSVSVSASISNEASDGFALVYHYANTPDVTEPALHRHGGTSRLLFDPGCTAAVGSYFTDHERGTAGKMVLARKKGA